MKIRVALLTAAAAAALVSASASAQQGPYVGIGAGATWIDDADVKGTPSGKIDFDTGYAGLLKGGYDFGTGWRAEGEFGLREWGAGNAGGDLRAYTLFANALYDFMPTSNWSPYLGAGAGLVRYSSQDITFSGVTSDDQDHTWGVQGIAGVWYALDSNWQLSADYRYMYTGDAKLSTTGAATIEPDNSIHTVMLGLTYKFGTPAKPMPVAAPAPAPAPMAAAPAPAPAPAPRAPETYIVFFAFDKSDISPVAAQVLDRAVADFRATGSTNVRIEGNADRSGSNVYNQRLSQRRADAVASYLRGKGIGSGAIQTVANGEEKPRVPTADGVRNDENRNAQIYLRK
ncbi:MAG: outer membrane beta-barrel protein [Ferrovibrio sp.]|uniref:OmpA family protein n=1 Tax=Ferrovibrio sp. TaxID=1917215 RepID=UPI002611D9E3|nr:OmpW family outer membrane protein [Ferrovibrio sp.]MCW0234163.1 outer membrane beta-barrel protein [Ferrovibrio sp.]